MRFNNATRITIAICATAIVLGVITGLVLTGGEIDASAILGGAGLLLGGLLGGIGAAGGPAPQTANRPERVLSDAVTPVETPLPRAARRLPPGPLIALALAGVLVCSSCVGGACQTERTIVSALTTGVESASTIVGDDAGDEWNSAIQIAHGAAELGSAAVDACALARGGAGWQRWVALALDAVGGLVGVISGAKGFHLDTIEVPTELRTAVELLRVESNQF